MRFIKLSKNTFNLTFSLNNDTINVPAIINFDLIKLIYDLNPYIYEIAIVNKKNEEEATITLLMRHFFEDLGLPQKYSHLNMFKQTLYDESGNCTTIKFTTSAAISSERPSMIPEEAELAAIEKMQITVNCVSPHSCEFNCLVSLHTQFKMLPFMEKMIGVIINKVFNRGKQFIENIKV